jgi:uncharacterized phage-associated protein
MAESSTLNSFAIAKYFIWLANETGSFISNLKLQKLVYYTQAWHLALHDLPLFDEDFEAWVHGPVIPDLYHTYKHFGWKPIQEEATLDLPETTLPFLKEVADEYFACDAYELDDSSRSAVAEGKSRFDGRSAIKQCYSEELDSGVLQSTCRRLIKQNRKALVKARFVQVRLSLKESVFPSNISKPIMRNFIGQIAKSPTGSRCLIGSETSLG